MITTSLVRAKMCELLAASCSQSNKDSAFIVGLFSTLDAMMDQPLPDILGTLPLNPDITEALLRQQGPYAAILNTVRAYERGDWDQLDCTSASRDAIADVYLRSLEWADATMREIRAEQK